MTDWDDIREQALAANAPEFVKGALSDRYLQPPYSILDTRKGDWLARRSQWLALGIKSEQGRGADWQPPAGQAYERSPVAAKKMAARGGAARFMQHDMLKGEGTNVVPGRKAPPRRAADAAAPLRHDTPQSPLADQIGMERMAPGTSIFDPVLCELAYRWWCPPGGSILDPFAGGSVRGIVAAMLGHPYTGIDLRAEQVASNREQAAAIVPAGYPTPEWIVGDATQIPYLLPAGVEYDMVFTCPPYYDLEVYSDDVRDLSAATSYAEFLELYRTVAQHSVARLRPGRHAVWVVSDVRDDDGAYYGLVADTIEALVQAGARYYNEAILVNAVGSAALRAERYFSSKRKLVRLHQNVVDCIVGDPERGWDADRPGPPDPQLALFEAPAPVPLPPPVADPPPVVAQPAPVPAPQPPSAPEPPVVEHVPTPVPSAPPGPPVASWEDPGGLWRLEEDERYVPSAANAEPSPVDYLPGLDIWLKRDDRFIVGPADGSGANGGKARSIERLMAAHAGPLAGLVTAASRTSVQIGIVARLARQAGVGCRVYVPSGAGTPEMEVVRQAGGFVEQVEPGYTSVLQARAAEWRERHAGWLQIPWGLECEAHVEATAGQVASLPLEQVRRIVVPVGSGMTLAGVVRGLLELDRLPPEVVGVQVGADPGKRLEHWIGPGWQDLVTIVGGGDYHRPAEVTSLVDPGGTTVELDPYYEAKCIPHLRPGDLLWVVGSRLVPTPPAPRWVCTECHTSNPSGYIRPTGDGTGRGMCYTCGDFSDFDAEVRA